MSIKCPLCQIDQIERLGKRSNFADIDMYMPYVLDLQRFDREIIECRTCGLQFIHPMYGESELAELYNQPRYEGFVTSVDQWFDFDRVDPQVRLDQSERKFLSAGVGSWLKEHPFSFSPKPTCLDIGCGRGHNMVVFEKMGFEVEGIDLSELQIEYVREHYDFPVRKVALEHLEPAEKYDCVVATNFIEHVRCPHAFMTKVATLLKADGLLVIETPLSITGHASQKRYCDIYHTFFFDHFTLALLGAMHEMEYANSIDTVFHKLEFTHVEMVVCFQPDERLKDVSIRWELARSLRASHNAVEAEYLRCTAEYLRCTVELRESVLRVQSFQSDVASPLFLVKTLCKWFRQHGVTGTVKGLASFLRDHYRGTKL
jgi:2-polyprenyl-3-methyl-5-hydroxy-6-metoxy-1,4-benzoquinol methylase